MSTTGTSRLAIATVLVALGLAAAAVWCSRRARADRSDTRVATSAHAEYVGRTACADCHPAETAAWTGSDHALAMQVPDDTTVVGDFSGATFEHFGVKSTFARRDGKYFVTTDGPDGQPKEFEVAYTFGVHPLQQ